MEFFKSILGKLVTGAVGLAVIASAISWWRMDEGQRDALMNGSGKIVGWMLVVLAVPWVSFWVIGKVARRENNAAGAALVFGITVVELVALLWMFNWTIAGATAWTFLVAGVLVAGVYNLFACDWIAEKVA